jgi:hypothetical protein
MRAPDSDVIRSRESLIGLVLNDLLGSENAVGQLTDPSEDGLSTTMISVDKDRVSSWVVRRQRRNPFVFQFAITMDRSILFAQLRAH